jgi:bla regulator protein BlaR1
MTRLLLALILLATTSALARNPGDDAWVFVRGSDNSSMRGDMRDLTTARKHLAQLGPGYLWFRHDGKEYVVQDGKLIEELEAMERPQQELGEEQGRLGQKQAQLGQEQGELGRKQGELGRAQADTAMRRANREMNGEKVQPLDRESLQELSETQRELARAQETLGNEQQKMGREQQKLGEQQHRLSKELQHKMEELIASSIRDGKAKLVHD